MNEFEKYPELAECLQEYASHGSFNNWQRFTNVLNEALKKTESLTSKEEAWVSVEDRVPQVIDKKMKPVLATNGKFIKKLYYFPEHFKTVEWEDWDDYTGEEDFPYTEEDKEKEVVWLRPGWYEEIDCEKCDGYWNPAKNVTHWQSLPPLPQPPTS